MKIFFFLILIALAVIASGCGTNIDSPSGEITAPPGSKIIINPSYIEVLDRTDESWHYVPFSISVLKQENQLIGRVRLRISCDWANPDSDNLVKLYDGYCSDTNPPTNPPKNSPFEAVTDDYGVYNLCVGFISGGGLEYKADLKVTSGTVYNSAEISIKAGT